MYNIYITQTNFQPKKFGISVKSFSNSLCRQAVGLDSKWVSFESEVATLRNATCTSWFSSCD